MKLKNEVEANSGNLCRLLVYYLVIFNDFVAFDQICHRSLESVMIKVTTRSWIGLGPSKPLKSEVKIWIGVLRRISVSLILQLDHLIFFT